MKINIHLIHVRCKVLRDHIMEINKAGLNLRKSGHIRDFEATSVGWYLGFLFIFSRLCDTPLLKNSSTVFQFLVCFEFL